MSTRVLHDTHHLTIGAPLLLILVFCFSFFLFRPASSDQVQAVSAAANTHKSNSAPSIQQLPVAKTKLSTIDPVQTVSNSSASSANNTAGAAGGATSTPQGTGASGGATSTPQNAPQNHGGNASVSGVSGLLNTITSPIINVFR
ncbi:MAG TPA: hypothetical protein VHB72_03545 [Candidatus Saccharimonadales bacterium]|nr:hypothetical protein [Candidatus Saccharimonadales bacterium]